MSDIEETVNEAVDRAEHGPESRLNAVIAVLVALIATVIALCSIKDGNIVQAMAQAQAKSIDAWSYYQAKSTKQHLTENTLELLKLQGAAAPGARASELAARIARYEADASRYEREKEAIRKEAEGYEKEYNRLNLHDDQFDMADAALSLSIALLGIAALTKKKWLVGAAVVLAAFGGVMALAGFFAWQLHPDALARFLS